MGRQWYNTGYEAADQEKERQARAGGPNRFWMKAGTTREIVFVDDEPLSLFEHQWRANGHWRNWATCCREISDVAPCCEKLGDRSRSFTGFYTIIDCSDHKDSKGTSYQYELKLLPAKLATIKLIQRKKTEKGSLIGLSYNVSRDSNDDPNCGNDFSFSKEVDLDKLFKVANYRGKKLVDLYKEATENPQVLQRLKDTFQLSLDSNGNPLPKLAPFNYVSLLAPKDPRELRLILNNVVVDGPGGDSAKDDEIPF